MCIYTGPENGGNVLDKFLSDTGGDSLVNKGILFTTVIE